MTADPKRRAAIPDWVGEFRPVSREQVVRELEVTMHQLRAFPAHFARFWPESYLAQKEPGSGDGVTG